MKPLDGIFVLDLSRILAGPFCSMLLSDMGATVVKVEEPGQGDDTRRFGPPFQGDQSTYYMSINRGKRSLALNMKAPAARPVLDALVRRADVLLENFRPGTAARLGLGWDAVHARNPRTVYVSVSGYGQTGPESSRPGYDVVLQGLGGLMSLTGEPDGPPMKMGISQADLVAGLNAFSGTLLALYARERTGEGQHVDVALLDCQVGLLTFQAQNFFATGQRPRRMGNQHASIAPYETFEAADGYLNVAVGNDRLWERFCEGAARPDLAADDRFRTNPQRVAHREALLAELMPFFKTRSVADWMALFDRIGVPAGPILNVDQVFEHPQVQAREMVVERPHPTLGTVRLLNNPIKLSATPAEVGAAPPLLGQHTAEILAELGFSPPQISDMAAAGAIQL
ncbi:MAG: CaiB/BaiF CoA transferase family protein [Candidatus Xenobia bacterium]